MEIVSYLWPSEVPGFVVVSQTCDLLKPCCARPSFSWRPSKPLMTILKEMYEKGCGRTLPPCPL